MSDSTGIGMWHTLAFGDADRMLGWLTAIGFREHTVLRSEADPGIIEHAELVWPAGGGVMGGSRGDRPEWPMRPGTAAAYLVTDDPDRVYAAALAAGGTSLYAPRDESYGGRAAGATDPDGNLWSFGSYQP